MQQSLFSKSELQSLPLADAKVHYLANWLDNESATHFYNVFLRELDWQDGEIQLFGKKVKIPRLQAWYGDIGTNYQYSGVTMKPLPWHPSLQDLKQRCESICNATFNSVLANLYRHGKDSMGMHADNEPELGHQPLIASISLGEPRNFDLKNRYNGEKYRIPLEHGSLLIMQGDTQKHWLHGIAKTRKSLSPRINLTFRNIKIAT